MSMRLRRALAALTLALLPVPFGSVLALDRSDYLTLPARQPVEAHGKIEVREFFWYGCPHCYALEPLIERWLERKPANVAFVRTPATAPRWLTHAQAYYAFEALGATERTHAALFRALHEQKRRLDGVERLAEFAAEHGIDPAKFRRTFESFGVRTQVERAKQVNVAFQVTSVPMFAVDGKYVTSVGMAKGERRLFTVLEALVEKAERERAEQGRSD